MVNLYFQMTPMGQKLMDPPSVEGWHTGKEWIDSGTLMERVNFAAGHVGDASAPGVRGIAERIAAQGPLEPEALVDALLDLAGTLEVSATTRAALVEAAAEAPAPDDDHAQRISRLLRLVVATPEYQFA